MRSHPPRARRGSDDSTACDEVADRLSDYADGELDASVARVIAAHLSRCPACARLAAELALTIAALHRISPARGVMLGWLAGPFLCGAGHRLAAPRLHAVHPSPGDET